MEIHEYAALFPMASDDELREMAADIKQRGLIEPVITLDGKILDGRNRAKACEMVGVSLRCKPYTGTDPLGDVLSWNLHRRHLSVSQRATLHGRVKPMFEKQARERMEVRKGDQAGATKANLPYLEKGQTRDQVASVLGISGRTVQDAEYVKKHAPEVFEKIGTKDAGGKEFTVNAAKKEVKERVENETPVKMEPTEGKTDDLKRLEKKNKPIPAPIEAALHRLETEIQITSGNGWKRCDKHELIKRIKSILKGIQA